MKTIELLGIEVQAGDKVRRRDGLEATIFTVDHYPQSWPIVLRGSVKSYNINGIHAFDGNTMQDCDIVEVLTSLGRPVHKVTAATGGLPVEDASRKAIRAYQGFVKYFPLAIAEVAKVSKKANEQHNPGQPVHWAKEKSKEEMDSLMNHMLDIACGVEVDPADGLLHRAKLAWRAMANLERYLEGIHEQ